MTIRLLTGDCRDVLPTLANASVHCCITSPPAEDPEDARMRDLFAEAAE